MEFRMLVLFLPSSLLGNKNIDLGLCFGLNYLIHQPSLFYIKARTLIEIFPPMLRKLWKDWELRVLVLLSLTLQIVLISFGNRRKYTRKTWIRIVLWCAYLIADWVATVALGVISNNLGDVIESNGIGGLLNDGIQLTAFWAPFLLLHLGGPDTITAYSMEDNELWLRHLLGLVVQTGVALYIFLVVWTGRIFIPSLLMFFAGIIKYGERTWVLRLASTEHLRESMLTPPDPGPNYSKFMREYNMKQFEGYHVRAEEVIKAQVVNLPIANGNNSIRDATHELVTAYNLFKSQSLFKEISWDKAFKVIEMELGFMYDVLYTKAAVIHSPQGWCLRLIIFSFTIIALGLFSVIQKLKYSIIDLVLTFLLLFNLLSFSLKEKHTIFCGIQKLLRIDGVIEKHRYTTCEEVHEDLKKFIFDHLKEKFNLLKETSNDAINIRTLCSYRGDAALEKFNRRCLNWSVEVEFDQSILIWHIATDLCYHLDCRDQDNSMSKCELSKWLSQYMLYILVKCPLMLPRGIGMIRFRDTCAEITQFFKERESRADTMMLLKMNTQVPPNKVKGDRSKTVLFDACRLASELQAISDKNQKWEMVSNVWVEMLANATCHCRGNYHAQQLKQGGELLTHVWLLMAHFGLIEQFQISQGAARAKLVVA
ncbi:hypothetical protein ACB092_05G015800 [Castanea dentata]